MEEGVERGVEIFAALQCLVIGLSYIAQPRAWVEMFLWLKSRGPSSSHFTMCGRELPLS
jgi:hypothetical protein